MRSDMVGHTSNASILEAKAGVFLSIPDQLELHADIKTKTSQNKQTIGIGNFLYCDNKAWTF